MRKSLLFLAPFLVVAICLFSGCGQTPPPTIDSISFNCEEQIYLKMGTTQEATASAIVVTNSQKDILFSYDTDVIDYNQDTGVITPVDAGTTYLLAQTGESSAQVKVVVERAVYCIDFELASSYRVKLNGNKESTAIIPSVGNGYNMGYEFESLAPSVATVNSEGIVTPISEGEAIVRVYAKSGCVGSSYTKISRTTKIIVEKVATQYKIELLDSDLNPMSAIKNSSGIDNYYLYSPNESLKPFYILKISSDISLKDAVHKLLFVSQELDESKNSADYLDFNAELQAYRSISNDERTVYMPFYAVSSGIIQYTFCDAGLNHSEWLTSDSIHIIVSPMCEQIKFVSPLENDIAYITDKSINFSVEVDMGECFGGFAISSTDNFKSIEITGNEINIDVETTGFYSFTITSNDPMKKMATYSFEVRRQWPQTSNFVCVSTKSVELDVDDYVVIEYKLSSSTSDTFYCITTDSVGNEVSTDGISINPMTGNVYVEAVKSGQYYIVITNGNHLNSDIVSILVK
ncbi:MAG: hypothetical protein IJ301_04195 [Clostridia bacterium]|nr:hypothetical protein [Clostridia bacterium]